MQPIATQSRRHLGGGGGAAILLLLFVVSSASASTIRFGERKVGGRTEIKNVASNEEVQELGRYSVDYYNLRRGADASLSFARVVEAQRQVVSGIKYYLRVDAWEEGSGIRRTFDAVVVVKPWLKSKAVVAFSPSAN